MNDRIRMILESFDHHLLDSATESMVRFIKQERVEFEGPIPLPNKKIKWTVNKSPHIDKNARNQYIRISYKRLLCVKANTSFVKSLSNLNLPSGVEINISFGASAEADRSVSMDGKNELRK